MFFLQRSMSQNPFHIQFHVGPARTKFVALPNLHRVLTTAPNAAAKAGNSIPQILQLFNLNHWTSIIQASSSPVSLFIMPLYNFSILGMSIYCTRLSASPIPNKIFVRSSFGSWKGVSPVLTARRMYWIRLSAVTMERNRGHTMRNQGLKVGR